MQNTTDLSEAKRILLEKYLQGNLPQPKAGEATIPRRTRINEAPLSFGQQQLWLLGQLIADTPVYNECVTLHLPGSLDVDAFKQSFHEIIRRHESWRTSFPQVDGQPVQRIQPSLTLPLSLVDLRYLPKIEREVEALRLATEDGRKPFDLAYGPLLRAMLIQLDDAEHRLYLTLHHIIFDGISVYQVFLSELHTLYEAFSTGKPSPLPELPIQYADFAIWQRKRLQENVLDKQLNYWKKQLEEAPAILELPTDRPRPLNPTYSGSTYPVTLSKPLTDALRALSRQEGCTLYMTMIAAFKTLLFHYTGQDDILVGTATGGRNHAEVQRLLGVFINMLVMRTHLTGDMSFRELLGRVREETFEAHAHQDVPFEYLVKELQPERGVGQNPFFQVLFMLEPPVSVLPSGWTLTHMDVKTDTSKFDLSLILEDRSEGLVGFFEYSTDLFDTTTLERMAGHLRTILEGIMIAPEKRLAELPVLTETERQLMLVEWNSTSQAYPTYQCLHQLFEAQVERTPDAVAVTFEDRQLTYRELNSKANQLAHHLQSIGVKPEALVGICVERSLAMVVALLGVLKAGGAYVPLDPTYPQERLAFMLRDAQVSVLLSQSHLGASLPSHSARVFCLDTDWSSAAQQSDENPVSTVTRDNLAYVIYTSGSTGKPKGVAIAHRSPVAFTHWALSVFPPEDLAGVLAATSICFDLSIFEIFVTLSAGGTVIVAENILHLPNVSSSRRVTLLNTVPSAIAELVHNSGLPASIRIVNLAGEPLHNNLAQCIYQQNTVQRVFNLYGPSEDTTYSTYTLVERGGREEPSIGRPIANTQTYILNPHLQPVPIGVVGELYIGGDGLAREYLNRPELTRERFIAHPFSRQPNARLYKTGDLARYQPDGNIEFIGRIDHQVKIRGFRVELGEIEEVLRQHPEVRETVVLAREDTPGDKRLVAYIVTKQGKSLAVTTLRSYLKDKLPHYMMPSTFMMLDALPLHPNGKINRRALPVPYPNQRTEEDTFIAPMTTVHHQLIQIWEELLDVQSIGLKDNFFSLGGHSLLAVRLVDRIEQVCGKKIPLATLFAGATVEHLADVIMGEEEKRPRAPVVAVQASGSKRPFFFLHGDWFGGGFYCLNLARSFDSDQPFYVLEPYNFDGLRIPPTFEEMATAHIQSLRTIQSEGPYLLGGFCNGGLMAYEMARQLQAEGQVVDLLVAIDMATPTPHKYVRRALSRIGGVLRLGQDKQLDWFLRYIYTRIPSYRTKVNDSIPSRNVEDESMQRRNKGSLALSRLKAHIPPVEALRHQWSGIYRWIAAGYVPGPYPGKLTLFWSSEGFRQQVNWRQISRAKEVEDLVFPGTHMSCKNENLHILAERLSTCLNGVQEATSCQ